MGSEGVLALSQLSRGSGGCLRLQSGSEMNLQNNPTRAATAGAEGMLPWELGLPLAVRHGLWASGVLEVRQVSQQHWGVHLDLTLQGLNVSWVHAVALKPVSKQGG